MNVKNRVNRALRRTTGYELLRRGRPTWRAGSLDMKDRLVAPVFILSPVRSGSTLLRLILDSHPEVLAPPEMPLRDVRVVPAEDYLAKALGAVDLTTRDLEHLLWDRLMHHQLTGSGKRIFVSKTPNNVFIWRRIAGCWPGARFIFLLRHPASLVASRKAERPNYTDADAIAEIRTYVETLEEARSELPGLTVRYEDLTATPEKVVRELCDYLDIAFLPEMLDYSPESHTKGLGDWSDRLRSGRIQSREQKPREEETPYELRKIARAWSYY